MSIFAENVICFLVETVSYVLCFLLIKKLKLKYRGALVLFLITVSAWQLIWQTVLHMEDFNLSLLAGLLFPLFTRRENRKGSYVFFLFIALTETLCYGFLVYIMSLARGYDVIAVNGSGARILCLLLFPALVAAYYLTERFLFRGKMEILLLKEHKITLLIALVCSVIGLAVHVLMAVNNRNMQQRMLVSGISFVCITVIYLVTIVWQGQAIWKNQKLQEEQSVYDYLTKSQQQYLDYIVKRDEDLRKFRHDIRAHMIIMHDLAEKKDFEGILSYIDEVEKVTQRNQTHHFTGNSTIDAIINDLKIRMDWENIEFHVKGKMYIEDEEKVFDISICFYNILLNAVEACEKLEGKDRIIKLNIEQYQKKIYFKICNRCNSEENMEGTTELTTDKPDPVNHGLGSSNVNEIVRKNGGKVLYSIKDHWFVTELLI